MRTFRIVLAGALAAAGISIIVSPPANAAASVGTFDQCQRGNPNTVCSGWTGGNLISGYNEDQVVPQRVELDVSSAGSYSFTTSYDEYSGGSHQIDFLATYNYTVTGANPCQSPFSASWCSGTPSTFDIPSDTLNSGATPSPGYNQQISTHELPQADRKWTLYGGTITGSTITHNGTQGVATVTFTTTGPTTAVLLFGAHLALTGPSTNPRAWAAGASTVNGNAQLEASIGGAKTHNIKTGPNSTPPPPPAAFTIAKTATPTSGNPGAQITYKVTVTNTGGQAGTATFTDDYDNALTNVTTPAGCTQGTGLAAGTMTCTTSSLAAGASQSFTYTANLPTTFTGAVGTGCAPGLFAVTNTATFAVGTNVTSGSSPSAAATVCVNATATFTVVKTPRTTTTSAGGNVIYDVVVTNTGSAPGSTSFTDNYDDAASVVGSLPGGCVDATANGDKKFTCTTGIINPAGTQTFTYTIKMPTSFTGSPSVGCTNGGYAVVNQVTSAAGTTSTTVCVTASATFSVTKTPRSTTAVAGGNVTYDVVVTNTGSAPGSTSFSDDYPDDASTVTLPSGCVDSTANGNKKFTCTTGTINPAGTQTITYTLKMPSSFTGTPTGCANGGYPVVNQVTITGGSGTSATVCVTANATFSVTKTPRTSTAAAGGNVIYDVVVTNTGTAPGGTSFTDNYDDAASVVGSLPNGCVDATANGDKKFTCTTGIINPAGTQTFTYTIKMPSSFTGSPSLACLNGGYAVVNQVTGGAGSASATVCVTASPSFSVTKTPQSSTAAAGTNVTYVVVVSNTGSGPGTATFTDNYDDAASVVGSLPNGCVDATANGDKKFTCTTGIMNPAGTQTFTYTIKMPASFSGNPGTGCSDGGYPVLNQVTGSAGSAGGTVCVTTTPAFSVTKTPRTSTAAAGGNVIYDVVVTNTGSGPGTTSFTDNYDDAASVVGSLPNGCVDATADGDKKFTCTTGTINPAGTQTFTYTIKMPPAFTGSPSLACLNGGYAVVNQVTGGAGSASATVCVTAAPAFSITKTASSPTSAVNGIVSYTVTVTNSGTGPGTTSFVDNYDDAATAVTPLAAGCVDSTQGTDKQFTCTTGTINPGGSQVFMYDIKMPASFTGTPSGCDNGGFPVSNTATLAGGGGPAGVTICVDASPTFTIKKTPRTSTASAGANVTYDVVVTNNGSAPGGTSFTDNYNDSATVVTLPSNCADSTSGTDKKFTCTTGSIDPGQAVTITYVLKMPSTFTGTPSGCQNGGYPVTNNVAITGSSSDSSTVCINAAPQMSITKTGSVEFTNSGDQIITYTISYANTGPAEATSVTITDQLPAGVAFSSCSDGCSTAGSPATVTWAIAPVAPLTGTGSVTLKVKVTTNQTCAITNVAQVRLGGSIAATSTPSVVNVTPVPDPSTAKSNGNSIGVQIKAKGIGQLVVGLANALLTGNGNNQVALIGQASSSQTGLGGPTTNAASLLNLNIVGIINTGVIRETSASVTTAAPAETRQTSTSEVASVCLVPVAGVCTVKSDTVRAVASTMANGSFSGYSAAGSTIENLYVAGIAIPVDLSQTTKIPLSAALFGKDSYVAINERTGSSGVSSGKYVSDLQVSMIHVKITNLALVGALDVVVAQATAHSEFGKTLVCSGTPANQSVSGHAYNAKLYTGPLLADLLLGYVQIAPLGGAETEHVAGVVVPSTGVGVHAQVADSSSVGGFTPAVSTSRSWSEVAGNATQPLCVLSYVTDCVLKATLVRSEARSTATSAGSISTDTGTQFLDLRVFGIPIAGTPDPNTTIVLPGIGFIILNEQFCDNGAAANHSCSGPAHSGITVRSARVVVTVANNLLKLNPGVEVILSEAHADTTYGTAG